MNERIWWHLARASGLVAWALVAVAVLLGLALAARAVRRPSPAWALDLHRWLGGLATAFTAIHVIAILLDSWIDIDVVDVLVPGTSPWRPGAVAWGVVALWLLAAIQATSLAMRRLPRKVWRAIHRSSALLYVSSTAHLVTAGSDAASPAVQAAVLGSIGGAAALLTLRVLLRRPRRAAGRANRAGAAAATPAGEAAAPG